MDRRGFMARMSAAFIAAIPATKRQREFWEDMAETDERERQVKADYEARTTRVNSGSGCWNTGSGESLYHRYDEDYCRGSDIS